jgi:hypothetical protein
MDYTLFRLFTYGLETCVYLCCIALCFLAVQRIAAVGHSSYSQAAWLGVTAGLAGEARIDFGLLFAVLLALLLARRWISPLKALLCGLIALAIVSPWFIFLHRTTGSWVPSSGKAESKLISLTTLWPRVKIMFLMTAVHVVPWSYVGLLLPPIVVTLTGLALLAWLWVSPVGRRARAEAPLAFELAALWLPGCLLLTIVYTVFFSSTHFYHRYMAVITVISVPVLAVTLSGVGWVQRHMVLAAAALFCFFAMWTVGGLHTGRVGNTNVLAAGYVRAQYPNVHVGAFQSGVVGYFNRNVENLDGKLNMAAWSAAQHNQLPEFIDHEGIEVLVDWPGVISYYLPKSYIESEWRSCPIPMTGNSVCLIRKSTGNATSELAAHLNQVKEPIRETTKEPTRP